MAEFIEEIAFTTTGQLGALPRVPVFVTRETVTGFTPDPSTGLIQINSSQITGFHTSNATAYGLRNALACEDAQAAAYPFVYILSAPTGVTSAMLDQANRNKRAWSFLIYVSQYQGGGTGAPGTEAADWVADVLTMGTWAIDKLRKIVLATYSLDQGVGTIALPPELQLGGSISVLSNCKVIINDGKHNYGTIPSPIYAYDNVAIAWVTYNINTAISRSWGSLSDSHDFAFITADNYTDNSRALIENNSLAQYNGAKDQAGSAFVYDTFMNDKTFPPTTMQIEAVLAKYYILDYVYVLVHNTLQAAGQKGLSNDDTGIGTAYGLVNTALGDCGDLNLILRKGNAYDFILTKKSAEEVTKLSPDWVRTGVWPAGVITAKVNVFKATHYITLAFEFN
jgi:hypothetical protein